MRNNIFAKIIFCVNLAYCNYSFSEIAGWTKTYPPFHKASTAAEKSLEHILRVTCDNYPEGIDYNNERIGILNYIEEWPHTDEEKAVKYKEFFTEDFIYEWSMIEKRSVDTKCNGKYIDGELCGIGFYILHSVPQCSKEYLYRTIEENENIAIIQYLWPSREHKNMMKKNIPIYTPGYITCKMVKLNNAWVIDGVISEHARLDVNF